MRLVFASFACAVLVGAASAAAAKPAESTLPSQAQMEAMSPAEFRAFLASPALSKENVLRADHQIVGAAQGPSCPGVENDGIDTSSAASLGPFAQMALLLSSLLHPHLEQG